MLALRYAVITSDSRPNITHTVTVVDWKTPVSCTCEDFKYKIINEQPYACKHMRRESASYGTKVLR